MEYYHLPCVHPELCQVSGVNEHDRFQGSGTNTGMTTSPLSYDASNPLSAELPAMQGLNDAEQQSAYWILIFPNIALFLLPHHLLTLLYRPDGAGRTIESADMLVLPEAMADPNFKQKFKEIFKFWDLVNNQDITAVERVQVGLQSKAYPGGRMCYRFEEPLHRFQNMVIDYMVGRPTIPQGDSDD
jgi:choline monooxygenase